MINKIKNIQSVKEFETSLEKKKHIVLLVYANWCNISLNFLPHWKKLNENLTKKQLNNFIFFQIEYKYYQRILKKENEIFEKFYQNIEGYPTTFVINNKGKITSIVGNNMEGLKKELKIK